jgi:hypothetical protein
MKDRPSPISRRNFVTISAGSVIVAASGLSFPPEKPWYETMRRCGQIVIAGGPGTGNAGHGPLNLAVNRQLSISCSSPLLSARKSSQGFEERAKRACP